MATPGKIKKRICIATAAAVLLIVGAMSFVSYFMHAVYEVEEEAVRPSDVPAAVRAAFNERFPGASDEAWELDESIYDVEFTSAEGHHLEAEFDADGTWLLTESQIDFADLPEKAQNTIKGKKGFEIEEIERIVKANGQTVYEAELTSILRAWEYEFDVDGNVIKKDREGPVLEPTPHGRN